MPVRVTITPLASTEDPSCLYRADHVDQPLTAEFEIPYRDASRDLIPLIGYRLRSHESPFILRSKTRLPRHCRLALILLESTVTAAGERPTHETFVIDIPPPPKP